MAGEFLLVVAEIGLLGDLAALAERIQHFVDGRLGAQELGVELELVAIGRVEELHPAVGAEDDDAGAEALQHVVMGGDVARQLGMSLLQRGLVDGEADQTARGQRRLVEVEQPALARHHLLLAFRLRHAELQRPRRQRTRRAVDVAAGPQGLARRQVEQPVEGLVAIDDRQRGVAPPDRDRQLVQQVDEIVGGAARGVGNGHGIGDVVDPQPPHAAGLLALQAQPPPGAGVTHDLLDRALAGEQGIPALVGVRRHRLQQLAQILGAEAGDGNAEQFGRPRVDLDLPGARPLDHPDGRAG